MIPVRYIGGLLGALLVTAIPANATPVVPDADIAGSLCAAGTTTCAAVLSSEGTITSGASYLTVATAPIPTVTAHVQGGAAIGWGSPLPTTGFFRSVPSSLWGKTGGYGGIQYYAMIAGPDGMSLPIDLDYTLTLTVTGGTRGAAWVGFNIAGHPTGGIPLRQLSTGASSTDGKTTGGVTDMTVQGTLTDTIMTNTLFDIAAMVQLNNSAGGTGDAFVDPLLYIDPSFAAIDPDYLSHYRLVISAGVGNGATAVPEPLTLSLFGAGFAGVAALHRRRKKASALVRVD